MDISNQSLSNELLKVLETRYGKSQVITSKELERHFDISGSGVRYIVNFLRSIGYPICSNRHGYYYATTKEEIHETILNLEARITGIKTALKGLYDTLTKTK